MKRTDITALFPDATADQIKTLMDINGNDINAAKDGMTELQTALTAAEAELETLRGSTAEADLKEARAKISELQADIDKRNAADAIRIMREKVSTETGVPVKLLTGEDEDSCKSQAEAIKAYATPAYPNLRDAGEPHEPHKSSTRDQFADWLNAQ